MRSKHISRWRVSKLLISSAILSGSCASGCASPTGDPEQLLSFRTDRASYTLGALGTVRLANGRGTLHIRSHGFPGCYVFLLEQRIDDDWVKVDQQLMGAHVDDRPCLQTDGGISLSRRQRISATFEVIETYFTPGEEYRFVVLLGEAGTVVGSIPFTIEG